MIQNVKLLYMLYKLGVTTRGMMVDLDLYLDRLKVDSKKTEELTIFLNWFGQAMNLKKLRDLSKTNVLDCAKEIENEFRLLESSRSGFISPFTKAYPSGMANLLDLNRRIVPLAPLFCRGNVDLLQHTSILLYGGELLLDADNTHINKIIAALKQAGCVPVIPVISNESFRLCKVCLSEEMTPVLFMPKGLTYYDSDDERETSELMNKVLSVGGLVLSLNISSTKMKIGRQDIEEVLKHAMGMVRNLYIYRIEAGVYTDIVIGLATTNLIRVFALYKPEETFKYKETVVVSEKKELCGLLL